VPASQKQIVQADITSVGGAAFDVFIRAPHTVVDEMGREEVTSRKRMIQFPLGAKLKVESVIQSCGGGATNTSVGFSRLGMKARFCGVVGDDEWGQKIQENLRHQGVLTDAAIVVENEISSFSIILVDAVSGQRTVLYSPNVNAHMCDPIFPREILRHSTWLFLNHLTDVSCVILDDCLDLVQKPDAASTGSGQGLKFAWNPGGSQIRNGYQAKIVCDLLKNTDILFLNAEEAKMFTSQESIEDALRTCIGAGAKIMCITDGAHGAYLSDGKQILHCSTVEGVKVVDTTGAGDGFAVGVTWSIFSGLDLPTALKAGMLNAASVVSKIGTQAGLLTDTEMRSRLSSTNLTVTSSSL